jgi:hypothetical protein
LSEFEMIVSTNLEKGLVSYLQGGGKVILLQNSGEPLPARRLPFWREAIKLFYPHATWEHFPQRGYSDMQFFGLASDVAFDPDPLAKALPGLKKYHPILRRLDAREFLASDYIFEAQVGQGILLGCSLRLWGGAGAQPLGWGHNVAGTALLRALIEAGKAA